jgi:hypothetical protein
LGDIGVKMVSTHFNYTGEIKKPEELKKSIDLAAEAGLKYILCPYLGAQKLGTIGSALQINLTKWVSK